MTLLDLEPVHHAFSTVLANFKDLVRDRTLTRKGGKGEDLYNFCKVVEQIGATGEIVRAKTALLARGNSDPQYARQLFEALFKQAREVRACLELSASSSGPYRAWLDNEELEAISTALDLPVLLVSDADSLRKLLLKTEPGERAIKGPEDIAERLISLGDNGQASREVLQLTAAVKTRVGKERDPGDGRVMTVKPRKGG
ncbi:MAG TPA: hypothetical protein VGL56_13970 [Fimbriimonadaceae bacterium]|jgi:hypothetical protein